MAPLSPEGAAAAEDVDRAAIRAALVRARGSVRGAAEALGVHQLILQSELLGDIAFHADQVRDRPVGT